MTKKVLLTGASGFVGSSCLSYLLDKTDWEFTCLCSWEHKGDPRRIDPRNKRVTVVTHDLTKTIPDLGRFDYIINIASSSHVDRSITDPVNFILNNVALVIMTLEYARLYKPDVYLHFSTDEVYGPRDHEDWDILLPSNPYAASKASQEMIVISYWKTFGIPVVITNSNNIIGPNQHKEKFVPKIIDLLSKGQEINIHVAKDGSIGKRFYNPVENVAAALHFILQLEPKLYPITDRPDRYSLPGGEELDNLEIATMIANLLGEELNYNLVNAEAVRPGYDQYYPRAEGNMLLDLGFSPPVKLIDGLKEIIKSKC